MLRALALVVAGCAFGVQPIPDCASPPLAPCRLLSPPSTPVTTTPTTSTVIVLWDSYPEAEGFLLTIGSAIETRVLPAVSGQTVSVTPGVTYTVTVAASWVLTTDDTPQPVSPSAVFIRPPSSPVSTMATDNFNRADGGLGANWTENRLTWQIVSNEAACVSADVSLASYTGASFGDDQYSQILVVNREAGTGSSIGPAVRGSGTSSGGTLAIYYIAAGGGTWELRERTSAGGDVLLQSQSEALNNGDSMKLEVVGTTLKMYRNSGSGFVQVGTDQTDATVTTGSPGMFSLSELNRIDNWEGDTVAAAAGQPTMRRWDGPGRYIAVVPSGSMGIRRF